MYNARTKKTENCEKLFVAYADDYNEVQKIKMGNIAAVTGLKVISCNKKFSIPFNHAFYLYVFLSHIGKIFFFCRMP